MIPDKVWILEWPNDALSVYTEPREGAIPYQKLVINKQIDHSDLCPYEDGFPCDCGALP